jgi:heterocycloanthracin/sonorensin family bacteriocin
MDDFKKELQGLNVDGFQADDMIPVSTQGQYYDAARQCGHCFHRCFNCFHCHHCFHHCFHHCGHCARCF